MAAPHLVSACLLAFSVALAHQEPGQPPAPAVIAQGASDRITLDVVANDKSGTPVAGLGQQAFTILDNKQPRKILSFEAKDGREPIAITLVLDAVNTSFSRIAYERAQLKKFLLQDGGKLAHPLSLAFFTDAGLKMQQEGSRDGNALAAFVDQSEYGLRSIRRSEGFYGAAERSQLSIRAMGELAAFESNRPGRKIVIWVSPGWPMLSGPNVQLTNKDQQGIFKTIVGLSTQLRQSGITLYSVDPLGTEENLGRENYYRGYLKGVRTQNQVMFADLALQVLAYQSGGRVINAGNDLAGEMEKCVRDASAYYVLSFAAVPADGPDDYHAVEVKIAQPGITAQTRTGYYAQPGATRTP